MTKKLNLESLKMDSFTPYLKNKFQVDSDHVDTPVELELVEIEDKSTDKTEGFSLIFKGPAGEDSLLPDDTHAIRHPEMGEWEMFMGPIDPENKEGIHYEAVFNRLKENK
ncbi:MAG: hypothetical protein GY737_05580 [Desulfobacteraceae bacterium]|nr:hypothetical protein [Desulfobacteraceae bacterium]